MEERITLLEQLINLLNLRVSNLEQNLQWTVIGDDETDLSLMNL